MERDLTAQAEQSRRQTGQQSLQPPQKCSSGLSTEAETPGPNHTCVWPPSEMWKQKLLLQLPAPPHQELRSRVGIHTQNTKNSPSTHMGYTKHHSATLEVQLLKTYLYITSEKSGFSKSRHRKLGSFGQFLSSVSSVFDH